MKLGRADVDVGPLGYAKFHINSIRAGSGNPAPKYKKSSLFSKGLPPFCKPLDQFLKVLGDFMRTIILQKCFKFDVIHFTGYGVIAEKPRPQQTRGLESIVSSPSGVRGGAP